MAEPALFLDGFEGIMGIYSKIWLNWLCFWMDSRELWGFIPKYDRTGSVFGWIRGNYGNLSQNMAEPALFLDGFGKIAGNLPNHVGIHPRRGFVVLKHVRGFHSLSRHSPGAPHKKGNSDSARNLCYPLIVKKYEVLTTLPDSSHDSFVPCGGCAISFVAGKRNFVYRRTKSRIRDFAACHLIIA